MEPSCQINASTGVVSITPPVKIGKMKAALLLLRELEDELKGGKKTDEVMKGVMRHVDALGHILDDAKKDSMCSFSFVTLHLHNIDIKRLSCSAMTITELHYLGIKEGLLDFDAAKVEDLLKESATLKDAEYFSLYERLHFIYRHVSMHVRFKDQSYAGAPTELLAG